MPLLPFQLRPPRLSAIPVWLAALAAFLVPLVIVPGVPDPVESAKIAVLALIVIAGALLFGVQLARTREYERVPWPFLALTGIALAVAGLATVFAEQRWLALVGLPGLANHSLLTLVAVAGFALLVTQLPRRGLVWVLRGLVVAGGLAALYQLFRMFGVNVLPIDATRALNFNLVGASSAALVLQLGATLLIGATLASGETARGWRVALAVAAGLAGLGLIASDHLVGWIVAGVGFAVLLTGALLQPERGRRAVPWLALGLALTIIGWLAPAMPLPNRAPADILLDGPTSRAVVRATLASQPAFGVGPENFPLAFAERRPRSYNDTPFWNVRFLKARTEFHQLLVTQGVVGTVAVTALVALLIVTFAVRLRRGVDPATAGVGAAWVGVVASALAFPFSFPATFLIALLGAALLAQLLPERRTGKLDRGREAFGLVALSGAIIVGVLALLFGARLAAAEVQFQKARRAIARTEDIGRVRALLRAAINLNGHEARYAFSLAQAEFVTAQLEAAKEQPDQPAFQASIGRAADAIERATALNPRQPETYEQVADLASFAQQVSGQDLSRIIADAFEKAAAIEPTYPLTPFQLGRVALGRADGIAAARDQIPEDQRAAADQERAAALDTAEQQFRRSKELKRDFTAADLGLALVTESRGQVDEALAALEAILATAPGDADTWFEYGRILRDQQRSADATRAYERVVALRPDVASAFLTLAQLYESAGRNDDARAAYQQVDRLAPNTPGVKEKIETLSK